MTEYVTLCIVEVKINQDGAISEDTIFVNARVTPETFKYGGNGHTGYKMLSKHQENKVQKTPDGWRIFTTSKDAYQREDNECSLYLEVIAHCSNMITTSLRTLNIHRKAYDALQQTLEPIVLQKIQIHLDKLGGDNVD